MKSFINLSLKNKIMFSVFSGVVILASILIFLGAKQTTEMSYDKAIKTAESEARQTGTKIEILLKDSMRITRSLGDLIRSTNEDHVHFEREEVVEILKQFITHNEQLVGTYIGFEKNEYDGRDSDYVGKKFHNESGSFIPYWNRSADGKIAYDLLGSFSGEWWERPKKTLKETYTEPAVYDIQGKDVLMISLTYPLLRDGRFIGLSGVDISLAYLQQLADNMKIYNNTGKMLLISPKGVISGYTGNSKLVGKNVKKISKDYTNILKNFYSKGLNSDHLLTKNSLKVFQKIDLGKHNTPWVIEIEIPKSVIEAPIKKSIIKFLIIGLVCTLLIVMTIWYIIAKSYKKLSEVEQNLRNTIHITQDTSEKLKVSSDEVSSSATNQASSVQETVTTLDQIHAMTRRNLDIVRNTEGIATRNQSVTANIQTVIDNMISTMKRIEESNDHILARINKSAHDFEKIVNIIKEISDKTKIINSIVSQTKLLSFNASVESARAGIHGKGFSVVAEEIGNLANTSGEAAEEISKMVEESISTVETIVGDTTDSVKSLVDESKGKVDEGVRIANECSSSFEQVMQNINEIKETLNQISEASSEQVDGVQNITDAMNLIDGSVNNNMRSANEAASLSNKMMDQSKSLKSVYTSLQSELFGKEE